MALAAGQDVENCLTYLDKMCDNEMRILVDYGLEGRDYELDEDGSAEEERYITLLPEDIAAGVRHEDNYVCPAEDYRRHMADVFMHWQD